MVIKTIVANSKFWYLSLLQVSTDLPGLLSDVLRHNQKSGKVDWKVLVVDRLSMKILSTSIKMHQLNKEGITREYLYGTTNNNIIGPNTSGCWDFGEEERTNTKYGGNTLPKSIFRFPTQKKTFYKTSIL